MTYHIKVEYQCPKCTMPYVPFKKGMTCPECGFCDSEDRYHNFINDVLKSLTINKIEYGRYRPDAWYIGTISDAVQSTCFHFFDLLEQQKQTDPVALLSEYTRLMKVSNESDRKFITSVLFEVYKGYSKTKTPRLIHGSTRIGRKISNLFANLH